MAQRKKRVHFSEEDDLMLLREVVAQNPFEGSWASVAEKLKASDTKERPALDVDARRARERSLLLLSKFEKAEKEDMKASGVEHEFGEKEQLLSEILDLRDEAERNQKQKKEEKADEEARAKELRKKAMETLSTPATENGENVTKRRRTTNNKVMDFLSDKAKQEQDMKQEEIELKKRQLELDTARFELEKEERKQKLENEREEKQFMFATMKRFMEN